MGDNSHLTTPQIVFIDPNVPDIGKLRNGLTPGVKACVIDPSCDGTEQTVTILSPIELTKVASVSIVGDGAFDAPKATQDIEQTTTGQNLTLDALTASSPAGVPFPGQASANFQETTNGDQ